MNEKMTWSELRHAIAKRTNSSEKEVAAFMTAFVNQVGKALADDKQVKISGLGIFRLQAVAPRKSVNIATGEAFVIDGYNKVTFAAESGVKELLQNATPQRATTTAEAQTPLQKLGQQAEEIVDILADLGQAPKASAGAEPEAAPVVEVAEAPVSEETVAPIEEQAVSEAPAAPVVEEPVAPIVAEPVVEATGNREQETGNKKQEKKRRKWPWVLLAIVLILALLGVGYYLMRSQIDPLVKDLISKCHTEQVDQQEPADTDSEEVVEPAEQPTEQAAKIEQDYSRLITTERMHADSRLAWMAYRYYGDKDLWVYLYDANRDRIQNANNVPVGTPIRVPKLSAEQRDKNNAKTQRFIEQIKQEVIK